MKTKILSYALVLTLGSALCFTSPLLAKNTGKSAHPSKTETYETDSATKAHKPAKQKQAKHSNSTQKAKGKKAEKVSE